MLTESFVRTEWIKVPVDSRLTFVGRETVCVGKSCHLFFYNFINKEEHIYSAYKYDVGDGIQCYAGHRQIPILAFAEKYINPRIIFLDYPNLNQIKILKNGAPEGYLTLTFSDHEYLITLSNLPEFEISVWNWRTTDKLYSVNSKVNTPNQYLCCSLNSPVSVVQFSENSSQFLLWEIQNAYKQCFAIKHVIKMPNQDSIVNCIWSPEGTLFVLNKVGCVYIMNSEYILEIAIYGGMEFGSEKVCFTWYKGGLVISDTFLNIKHFKRTNKWYETWRGQSTKLMQLLASSSKDILVGWSNQAEIMEFDTSKNVFVVKKSCRSTTELFCIIYPLCNYFASLNFTNNGILIWESLTGIQSGCFDTERIVSTMNSNPIYPYVAAGLVDGTLKLISIYDPNKPKLITKFSLYDQEISKIIFNNNGNIIVTASLYFGLFFIIKGLPGEVMEILHYIDYRRPSLDICVTEDEKNINLYILVHTDRCMPISQQIVIKIMSKTTNKIRKKKYISQKYNFTSLKCIENQFIAKVYKSKNICCLEFSKKSIKTDTEIYAGHCLRHFTLSSDNHHVFTYGYDGLVIIRNKNASAIVGVVLPHHRHGAGVRNAIVDPYLRYVISYGALKEMVCTSILDTRIDDRFQNELTRIYEDMKPMFSESSITVGFEIDENNEMQKDCKTYLDFKKKTKILQEQAQFEKERNCIMEEFLVLKKEVQKLLEENLNGPEIEKIDILEFYQHTLLRQHKEEINKKKCEWTVKYYTDLIRAQNEVWAKIKTMCWDTMEIKGTTINGIFTKFFTDNYTKLPDVAKYMQDANYAFMYRQIEEMLREGDFFKLWVPMEDSVLLKKLEDPPNIIIRSESARIKEALQHLNTISNISITEIVDKTESFPSSTIAEFIEPTPALYDQDEIHTYTQIVFQMKMFMNDHETLRSMFNKKYEEMKQLKIKEMNTLSEKCSRLKFILSELKLSNITVLEPAYQTSEHAENVIIVKDSEIGITPYISPSEQAILDWKAAEAERIRLLLLADDFREKALIRMMDGVLEVRWEDTLKRDIPKPKCMLEKNPENFNEEDLRAIKDYEDKVAFLNSERLMYKNMLEQEYAKTAETVRDIIRKFNTRLQELCLHKIRVETARCQQGFIIQHLQYNIILYLEKKEQQKEILENIKGNEKSLSWITHKISEINDALIECKNYAENLVSKEKQLEKSFKKDFQDTSALIQEQSYKLYKKQPKMHIKGINIASLVIELGACCVSQEKSPLLTQECLDYLRSVDNLDQYVGVPNTIDEQMYKVICKHRRLRIENDLKIKANFIEQAEIDASIQVFQKYSTSQKEMAAKLTTNLAQLRQDQLKFIHDKKLQIVIKTGLVEVPMTGKISDFDNAILIHREEVENINKMILRAGNIKLKVMNDKMIYRRKILMKEWEHKKMKLQIRDLNNHLYLIEHVKVTKEIQQYLRQRAKGNVFDKGMLTLDQEIESKKKSYETILNEKRNLIDELDKQIKEYKKKNKILDQQIFAINVDVCEQQANRDLEFEKKNKEMLQQRMAAIVKRSKLVKQVQDQHNEILVLQTELELLRLKTYPTLRFKTLI